MERHGCLDSLDGARGGLPTPCYTSCQIVEGSEMESYLVPNSLVRSRGPIGNSGTKAQRSHQAQGVSEQISIRGLGRQLRFGFDVHYTQRCCDGGANGQVFNEPLPQQLG